MKYRVCSSCAGVNNLFRPPDGTLTYGATSGVCELCHLHCRVLNDYTDVAPPPSEDIADAYERLFGNPKKTKELEKRISELEEENRRLREELNIITGGLCLVNKIPSELICDVYRS